MSDDTAPANQIQHTTETLNLSVKELVWERNRGVILSFEFLWGVGLPFVAAMTLIPGFLENIGINKVWIGLVPALYTGAIAVVQPLSAYVIRVNARRLKKMRRLYMLGSLGYVLLGVAVLGGLEMPLALLVCTLLAVLLFSVTAGMGDPHYVDLVVAAVTTQQRGRYFGLRAICLALGGVIGGQLSAVVLGLGDAPFNFGLCFIIGGVLFFVSTFSLLWFHDKSTPIDERLPNFRIFLSERIMPLLRHDAFRMYLISLIFFTLAASSFSFLGLLLKARLQESDRIFGLLATLFWVSTLVMSWFLGVICDRWGSRRAFALSMILFVAGVLGCLFLQDRFVVLACYTLAASWSAGGMVAATDLALKITPGISPAEVFATKMVAMAPAQILGPVVAGAAIDYWSYEPVLLASTSLILLALVALAYCRVQSSAIAE